MPGPRELSQLPPPATTVTLPVFSHWDSSPGPRPLLPLLFEFFTQFSFILCHFSPWASVTDSYLSNSFSLAAFASESHEKACEQGVGWEGTMKVEKKCWGPILRRGTNLPRSWQPPAPQCSFNFGNFLISDSLFSQELLFKSRLYLPRAEGQRKSTQQISHNIKFSNFTLNILGICIWHFSPQSLFTNIFLADFLVRCHMDSF